MREMSSLRFCNGKDGAGRPPSVESASCIGLLGRPHLSRSDSATPKASTLSFLDGKLREMASLQRVADDSRAPKLFGVSLNSKAEFSQKRPRGGSSWGAEGEPPSSSSSRPAAGVAGATPVSKGRSHGEEGEQGKCMKVELGLELRRGGWVESRPSAEGAQPWLRISSSSCAERVFM
jgi:hypothetical protein